MDTNTQYLRAWAAENVWSAPRMSGHYILQPQRVTVSSGVFRQAAIGPTREATPDRVNRWHIYQIGGIDPNFFNLFWREAEWISLQEVMNKNKLMTYLYANNGVEIPRCDVYYKFNNYGNLLVAVRINKSTKYNYASDVLNIRLFANRWWETTEGMANPTGFQVQGELIETTGQIAAFATKYQQALAKCEHPFQMAYWHNGISKKTFNSSEVVVGDTLEYVIDGSIYREEKRLVDSMEYFTSTLDQRQKYLVHLSKPGKAVYPEMRLADLHVQHKSQPQRLLMHRNQPWQIRAVTHNDFSVAVNVVMAMMGTHQSLFNTGNNPDTYEVNVRMRRSAAEHPLILDPSFMAELYNLPEEEIQRAMIGPSSTLSFWKAAALEQSGYTKLVEMDQPCNISGVVLEQGLGYYAAARILADTPMKVTNPGASGFVDLPFMLCKGATIYEYDANGLFLGWKHHYIGSRYFVANENCYLVEAISGLGGNLLEEMHGVQEADLSPDRTWRIYSRQRIDGVFTGEPVDVTGTNKYTLQPEGAFQWLDPDITHYPTVRSDARFFAADYKVIQSEGVLQVPLLTSQMHAGITSMLPIGIPCGQLDVIFNKRSLVYGIEYYYRNGVVYITTKEHAQLAENGIHDVHVRFSGFCRKDMSIWPEEDVGFVVHGKVSHNLRYNLRFGRVMRAIVGGRAVDLATPVFAEQESGLDPNNPLNGKVYSVKDLFVPLRPYVSTDTWAMIEEANSRSKEVSDYLTARSPQPDLSDLQIIPGKQLLYSPFMSKIISDMVYGRLALPNSSQFSQQQVAVICKNYEYLLEVDPGRKALDERFVNIQPHLNFGPISVQANAYAFLDAVNRFYFSGKISLGAAVTITA